MYIHNTVPFCLAPATPAAPVPPPAAPRFLSDPHECQLCKIKVRDVGAPAWSILAVTFTKKASEEMRVRVRNALGDDVSGQV